ncbi:hypothetical protein GJ654_14800 [Rhodoblastus acidophilus]|uniref:Uncharacterized protein n=1 Tax=Rhodoblastus acidophilus TaxID=1074 RepID=A0A6N8DR00_RHOAC|nr:S-layer family protein [Rhodoblastus acidophilus]MCW2275292.1 hypothetical protein [Rhodoblastus acidophilus]MTV32256.1 hypothetical protein [Rhodoblastus acidophilus]
MATDTWTSDIIANWNTAAYWSAGIPIATSNCVISAGGAQVTSAITIASLVNAAQVDFTNAGSSKITGAVTNTGVLTLDAGAGNGGSNLTISGVLTNTGVVLLGATDNSLSKSDTVAVGGLDNTNGVLMVAGGAASTSTMLVKVNGAAGFGVTGKVEGWVSLSGYSTISFASGAITAIDANAGLSLNGANAFVALAGSPTSNSALTGLRLNAGALTLENGVKLTTSVGLTNLGEMEISSANVSAPGSAVVIGGNLKNTGQLSVDYYNTAGGSSLKINGSLINYGAVNLGSYSLTRTTTVTTNGLYNASSGYLYISSSLPTAFRMCLNVQAAAGFGVAGVETGTVFITRYAGIQFASGQITTIQGNLGLSGANAFVNVGNTAPGANSALAGLQTVTGTFSLNKGAKVTTTGALTILGSVYLDNNGYSDDRSGQYGGKSQLTIGGVLTNSGALAIGGSALTGPDTVTTTGVANTGMITLKGGADPSAEALLNVTGAAGFGTAGVLSGAVSLSGNSMVEFASGQITTIAGGASLKLDGPSAFIADAGALTSNSALTGLTTNSGTLSLSNGAAIKTTAGLTNTSGGYIYLDVNRNGAVVNGGTSLALGGVLTNKGAFSVGSASLMTLDTVTATGVANSGTITLTGGASWSSRAVLNVTGVAGFGTVGVLTGQVNLSGNALLEFASGQINTIARGASLMLDGPSALIADAGALTRNSALNGLALNGGSLNLRNGAALTTSAGLTNTSGSYINLDSSGGAGGTRLTLTGVLKNIGSLYLGASSLTKADTLTATGVANTGTITLTGGASPSAQALLNVTGTAGFGTVGVLSGQVSLSGSSMVEFASGQITTIAGGAWLTLNGPSAFIADAGALTSNSALKGLAANSGSFYLYNGAAVTTAAGLTNNSYSYIGLDRSQYGSGGVGGTTLTLGGVLTNSGTVYVGDFGMSNSDILTATGVANTGTITLEGGGSSSAQALLNVAGAAGFGSTGVLSGQVYLGGNSLVEFASGQITTIGGGASLTLNGTNAFIADAGALTSNSALQGLTGNSGCLYLNDGVAVATTASLTNDGSISLENYSGGTGGTTLALGGVLTNNGSLTVDARSVTNSDSVTATGVVNNGFITLRGDESSSAQALFNVSAAAGFGITGVLSGSVYLSGTSMVEFASGQITTIEGGSSLTLNGPSAFISDAGALTSNSALKGLATNNGNLSLYNGAVVTTSGGLNNTSGSSIYLDANSNYYGPVVIGGTRLTLGGVLSNTGYLYLGSTSLAQSDILTATGLANGGTISVTGGSSPSAQAVLNVTGAAGFGTAGLLKGQVSLSGNSLVQFASGQITSVASGASLTLNGSSAFIAVASAPTSNSALKGLAANSGSLSFNNGAALTTTAGLTNNSGGTINLDNAYASGLIGGSRLTLGGVLTNSGNLIVGSTSLMTTDTFTATGIANTGFIGLAGGASSSAQAVLNVTGAAGFGTVGVLSGSVNLIGNAMVEFASGQITTIAGGASLLIDGSNAFIADAGALTSNSALKGLSTNSGNLTFHNGVVVATTVGLTNSSSIHLDDSYYKDGGTRLTLGGVLTNSSGGSLSVGSTNLKKSDTLTATGLANAGTITLVGGGSSSAQAVLNVTGAAGFGASGVLSGEVNLSGNALVAFASGQITTIASGAGLALDGPNAFIADVGALTSSSALKGLATNSGSLYFNNGVVVATTGALTNSAYISLDTNTNSTSAGSSLNVGGVLTNGAGDYITIGSSYYASGRSPTTISATGGIVNNGAFQDNGNTLISSAVTGTGSFYLYNSSSTGAIIEFDSSVGSGQSVYLQGKSKLVFGAGGAMTFGGKINGWAVNDLLDIKGFGTGTTSSFSSNVLTLTNGSNVANFAFAGTDGTHFSLTSSATETFVSYV